MAQVVVVGGGFAGLAVAARLARGRHRVVVVDRAPQLGGELRGIEVDGRHVPSSAATFTMPAVLRDLFHKTGKPIESVVELAPVDPARRYVFADATAFDLPSGNRAATIAAFDATFGPGAGEDWETLLVRGREMWEVLRRAVVEQPIAGRHELTRALASWAAVGTLRPGRSLASIGRNTLREPGARRILDFYADLAGVDRRHAPAALAVLPYIEHAFGTWEVVGGGDRLATALVDRAVLRGAELRPLSTAVEITVDGQRATGVRLADGEHLPADVVVAAIDVRAANALIVGAGPAWRISRRGVAGSRFTAVLARAGGHDDGDGDENGKDQPIGGPTETVLLEPDAPDRAAPTTMTITRHLVDGKRHLTLSAPVSAHGRGSTDWREPGRARAYAQRLCDLAARRGQLDAGWVVAATRSPADLEDLTGAPGGTVLGPPARGLAGAFGRAANRSAVPNLYAVGAGTHPGATLPFVGLSAVLVSDLVGVSPRVPTAPD